MDPVWVSLLGGATGAAVVGYLAKTVFERGLLRALDELRADVKKLQDDRATTDKRLELGNQKFEHYERLLAMAQRRIDDLEDRERALQSTRIMDTRVTPKGGKP